MKSGRMFEVTCPDCNDKKFICDRRDELVKTDTGQTVIEQKCRNCYSWNDHRKLIESGREITPPAPATAAANSKVEVDMYEVTCIYCNLKGTIPDHTAVKSSFGRPNTEWKCSTCSGISAHAFLINDGKKVCNSSKEVSVVCDRKDEVVGHLSTYLDTDDKYVGVIKSVNLNDKNKKEIVLSVLRDGDIVETIEHVNNYRMIYMAGKLFWERNPWGSWSHTSDYTELVKRVGNALDMNTETDEEEKFT